MPSAATRILLAAITITFSLSPSTCLAESWSVPVAGNTFRAQPSPGRLPVRRNQLKWGDDSVYSTFFRIDRPARLTLSVKATASEGSCRLAVRAGSESWSISLQESEPATMNSLGTIAVDTAGYVRLDFQRIDGQGAVNLSDVRVDSDEPDLSLDFVQSNDGNMFYWGRRGPSVHLQYRIPRDTPLRYAYSEVTVPEGQDQIGSFFMANGFSEGYFGMQVNSPSERRVLFSIWSPYRTDNPKEIPEDQRVKLLGKGDTVRAQDFGNEGSGGQSFLVFPWKAGTTYRFLTEVIPDGKGSTQYTSWFGAKDGDLQLIASFRRPKTDKHLTGFHSFLENFSPSTGHLQRSARYGNQWVCDAQGKWTEVTSARLTGDNTARRRQRLDYAGGREGDALFLRNCGFFDRPVELDQRFQRDSTESQQPEIDFESLPR